MLKEMERLVAFVRPAFSRQATYRWFVIVFVGFLVRTDTFGVSSIVRALSLTPGCYTGLLHFFHSSAWSVEALMALWWQWLATREVAYRLGDRIVLVGDHTKTPKDGRKIPAVTTLHQESETGSKPAFFRGHHWGCIALLVRAADKWFATPLWANIQEGPGISDPKLPKTIRIVRMAQRVAAAMGQPAYLVLDAFFAVGSVFQTAAGQCQEGGQLVHILTRAKKNVVGYRPARPPKRRKRGRKRKYGKKLRLMELFDSKANANSLQTAEALVYGRRETVRTLTLDLLWKPIQGMLRFILVETSRGRMVLMSSDLNLDPLASLQLYCRRVTIETLFDTLKNVLGGMAYHFWSRYLRPASRRPKKNSAQDLMSSDPTGTQKTLAAIEKFVNIQLLVVGILHMIAKGYPEQVKAKARCWLRTVTAHTPSEFVTRTALVKAIKTNLCGFAKDWITQLIRQRQEHPQNQRLDNQAA
jgi:hypothetical protein